MKKSLANLAFIVSSAALCAPSFAQSADVRAADAESAGIQDIVVTAQRRSENLQKSSVAISVLGSEDIERRGIVEPKALNNLVPGIVIAEKGANTQVYLRGVGDNTSTPTTSGAIAVSVDGVYIDRPAAIGYNFFDLERVEVLKGPQGTLYGRNATGGAVNLITAKPKRDVEGYVEGEIGNYDLYRVAAAINLPAGDKLAFRVAGQVVDRGGYLKDGYSDRKSQAVRAQMLWEPTADVNLRLSADYAHLGGRGEGSVIAPRSAPGLDPWLGSSHPDSVAIQRAATIALLGPVVGGGFTPATDSGYMDGDFYNVSAELNWDLGFATMTVIPGYRSHSLDYKTDAPGYLFRTPEHSEQTTLEWRLGQQSDRLKWTVGAYFFDINQDYESFISINRIIVQTYVDGQKLDSRAYAAFGQMTYGLTDSLRLIGGIRYTHETKLQRGAQYNIGGGATAPGELPAVLPVPAIIDNDVKYNATNYKVGFEYDVAPQSMLYATMGTGFKAGGFFSGRLPNTYKPERIRAYEVGLRNRFFNNMLQVNLEGFYWKYRDLQTSHTGLSNGFAQFLTENAGAATMYGLDASIELRPSSHDKLSLNVEYLNAKYKGFTYDVPANSQIFGLTTGCSIGAVHPGSGGASVQTLDCSGFQVVRSPKWSGNIGYEHNWDLQNGGEITARLDGNYASSRWLTIDFIAPERVKSYFVGDASLTYSHAESRWSVTGYVSNIFNEAVYSGGTQYPLARNLVYANINPPRTYGIRGRFNF